MKFILYIYYLWLSVEMSVIVSVGYLDFDKFNSSITIIIWYDREEREY
jgi:hypothetical protein